MLFLQLQVFSFELYIVVGLMLVFNLASQAVHDDVIKWKHFPRNWPFVREIHRSPVNFPHKGQWRGVLMFSLIYAWTNDWVNNREAGDLRRQHGHYDVIVMLYVPHVNTWSVPRDSILANMPWSDGSDWSWTPARHEANTHTHKLYIMYIYMSFKCISWHVNHMKIPKQS